ncbi:peroxisome assembly protein 26 isoform X1 [Varanus komodoensis]|uniref:peroxisome assembly protein 26 isoform X1 n=1 Tax=Varanus komodoensis TaxID=61221 RepID=UPI001CF7A310|nr:peroxisome assembly protein 26 isoform X1 [Varanus komodoensis]XP_044311070.1 peroxisome assembly protein 26 isoform X1 [Varanus komodoensis]
MRNDWSVAFAGVGGAGNLLRSSEPVSLPAAVSEAASFLEEAADLLVMHRDFAAAVERCEKGCRSLMGGLESDDSNSSEELKCSLCIVGVQALAEMNRWREVLPWILQYYHDPEHWPPKILELCILLHSKVEEPHVMLEVGSDWIRSPANQHEPNYGLLVQLHLFHVLLPLGRFAEAEKLVQGCSALSGDQQLEVHERIQEKKHQWLQREEECPVPEGLPEMAWTQRSGSVSQKVMTVLAQLGRVLGSLAGQLCSISYKKTLLAAFMLCVIVVRLDPASPTSLPFLYRLLQLFHQARMAAFPPHPWPPIED